MVDRLFLTAAHFPRSVYCYRYTTLIFPVALQSSGGFYPYCPLYSPLHYHIRAMDHAAALALLHYLDSASTSTLLWYFSNLDIVLSKQ
jgi:hypothetical protein